jgi:hypothetical protein
VVTNANINGNLRSSSSEVIEMSTEQEQELPVMSYDRNANTLTVSYPEQLFASDANPRTIAVSDQNGLVANITAGQAAGSQVVAYTPRSVIFVFTATSSYLYGDTIQLADVTVDVDRAPVTIDGRRYLASVIYDDGTEYPCMISIH